MKLKKGDSVKVMIGRDKGKIGKIERVLLRKDKIIISDVNIYKKHVKPQGENRPGGIVDVTRPMIVSKVAFICPSCKKATKIGFRITNGKKERICKKCQATV